MRKCTKCKINKPRNKTSSYCKDCHNEYQKAYYKKNPKSIKKSFKNRKLYLRNFIIELKNSPCVDCKKSYPYYVMDFDHLRDKKFNLSISVSKMYSEKKILEEVSKCDLVCANCHRIRTFTR